MVKPKQPKASKPHVKLPQTPEAIALREKLYVEAFLINNGNKTQAALAAGHSKTGAERAGIRLSARGRVKEMIEAAHRKTFDSLEITRERILRERARLAFHNPRLLLNEAGGLKPFKDLSPDLTAAITGVKWVDGVPEYKFADKNPSLTSLERQLGMYKADNEQQPPPSSGPKDVIEVARALAFVLAQGARKAVK